MLLMPNSGPSTWPLVVVGVDGSDTSQQAMEWAVDEAARRGWRCEIVQVWHEHGPEAGVPTALLAQRVALTAFAGHHADAEHVDVEVLRGRPVDALLAAANDAELLVIGSRGRGAAVEALLGSVSEACLHHARCPVVVVPASAGPHDRHGRIVAGVDGSAHADAALRWAAAEAALRSAQLTVVHAWRPASITAHPWMPITYLPPTDLRDSGRATLDLAVARAGLGGVRTELVEGDAATTLLAESDTADLIVVGNRGLSAWGGTLLGSVSQECARHARCPVAVVR